MKTIFKILKLSFFSAPKAFLIYFLFSLSMPLVAHIPKLFAEKELVNELIGSIGTGTLSNRFIIWLVIFGISVTILGYVSNGLYTFAYYSFAPKTERMVAGITNRKIYNMDHENFYDSDFYDSFEHIKNNRHSVHVFAARFIDEVLVHPFTVLVISGIVFFYDPYIILIFIICNASIIIFNTKYTKKKIKIDKELAPRWRKSGYYEDLLSKREHSRETKLYRLQGTLLGHWFNFYYAIKHKITMHEIKHSIVNHLLDFINFTLKHAYVFYLLYLTYQGKVNVGEMVMIYSAMNSLMQEIPYLMRYFTGYMYNLFFYAKVIMDFAEEESKEGLRDVKELVIDSFYLPYGNFTRLELTDVAYKYPNANEFAVKDISLTIDKGEVVSILGYNGSGKTTLSKLISGVITPKQGKITFNNQPLDEIDRFQLYKYFGIAYQDYNRFSMTLKENIGVGMIEKFTDEEVEYAIRKGNLNHILEDLPEKENTLLGKDYDVNGLDLSGGQWQRISLARAYMGSPELLILDEPTASIDPMEELRLLQQFKQIIREKTAILISHRIGFARLADRIIMMNKGEIVEVGSHEDLLKIQDGYYRTLYNSQKELYEKGDDSEKQ